MTTNEILAKRAMRGRTAEYSVSFEDGLFLEVHWIDTLGKWVMVLWPENAGPHSILMGAQKNRVLQCALVAAKTLEAAGHVADQYPDEVFA